MTRIEKKSFRKREAIKLLVEDGEYSVAYAIMLAEQLNDNGKLLDDDYDNLMEWLEEFMNRPVEKPTQESAEEEIAEPIGEESEGEVE